MTHTTTVESRRNSGSYESVFATVDVTSLDSAGEEPFDAESELGLNDVFAAEVGGMETAGSYLATWDHLNEAIHFADADTGSGVTAGTDVGEVRLSFHGNPST